MFGNDTRDKTARLAELEYWARQKSNFNQGEARAKMAEWLADDPGFRGYDPLRLAERVQQCRNNGAVLDLDDPQLKKGGQPRPLDRWR